MGRFTARIIRGLAATTIAATAATMVAGPASAAAVSHFSVDTDHVVLGENPNNSFKAFDGHVESWMDGTSVRATLTGPFVGRGTLRATWIFHDGSTSSNSDYTAGVQHNINFTSPADKTVVKFTFTYTPNTGTADSQTNYVGDSPESTGSCDQLDLDDVALAGTGYVNFNGSVKYTCTADGNIRATVSGQTRWGSATGTSGHVRVTFWYADGSSIVLGSAGVSPSSQNATWSDSSATTKDVTWVGLQLVRNNTPSNNDPITSVKFGDA
jgi:hypothetical protein